MSDTVNPLPMQNTEDLPTLTQKKTGATGAFLGLNEAVRLSGVSKPTFLKYVEKGRLSPTLNEQGRKVYQVVDIQRVFPNGATATSQVSGKIAPSLQGKTEGLTAIEAALLKAENERLKEKLEAEQDKARLLVQIADDAKQNAEKWQQQAERATLMLTHRQEPATSAATQEQHQQPEPKGFFGRLFRGSK